MTCVLCSRTRTVSARAVYCLITPKMLTLLVATRIPTRMQARERRDSSDNSNYTTFASPFGQCSLYRGALAGRRTALRAVLGACAGKTDAPRAGSLYALRCSRRQRTSCSPRGSFPARWCSQRGHQAAAGVHAVLARRWASLEIPPVCRARLAATSEGSARKRVESFRVDGGIASADGQSLARAAALLEWRSASSEAGELAAGRLQRTRYRGPSAYAFCSVRRTS